MLSSIKHLKFYLLGTFEHKGQILAFWVADRPFAIKLVVTCEGRLCPYWLVWADLLLDPATHGSFVYRVCPLGIFGYNPIAIVSHTTLTIILKLFSTIQSLNMLHTVPNLLYSTTARFQIILNIKVQDMDTKLHMKKNVPHNYLARLIFQHLYHAILIWPLSDVNKHTFSQSVFLILSIISAIKSSEYEGKWENYESCCATPNSYPHNVELNKKNLNTA